MKFDYDLKKYDLRLFFYIIVLNVLGIFIVRSATNAPSFKDAIVVRQIMGSFAGLFLCILLSIVDYRFWLKHANGIYLVSVLFLAGVKIFGTAAGHNADRWIRLPIIGQVQPAEFVKIGLIIFFAAYFAKIKENINQIHGFFLAFLLYLLPIFLILIEPNLSTAVIITVIIAMMLFVSPFKRSYILTICAVGMVLLFLFFYLFRSGLYDKIPLLRGYQANRILTFLDPSKNAQTFRQQLYSIMAIGSGQLNGKGLYNQSIFSIKNGNFLSEEDNDFIFAVIGEELGFRGSVVILILFLLIVIECLIIAHKTKNLSGRLICVGVMAWIGFQTYTNIAVATGLFPNTGVTLPFFSRGVSSLISVYAGLGLVANVSLQREG